MLILKIPKKGASRDWNLSFIKYWVQDFMNLYKNGTVKASFLLNDTTLASDHPLPFRGDLLERI